MQACAYQAELDLQPDVDPASVGAEVTRALCGQWAHDGPCRWPHNNAIRRGADGLATFRTVYVCAQDEAATVASRIDAALSSSEHWTVVAAYARDVTAEEQPLADSLLHGPRL